MKLKTIVMAGLFLLAASLVTTTTGCASDACKGACDKIAECLGIKPDPPKEDGRSLFPSAPENSNNSSDSGDSDWKCPLGDTCTPGNRCVADCVLAASCEAITGKDIGAATALAQCQVECEKKDLGPSGKDGQPRTDTGDTDAATPADSGSTFDGQSPDSKVCVPSCGPKKCGDNGCGGSCGKCAWPQVCNSLAGQCVDNCVPNCGDRVCGDDGCGGSCGPCTYPNTCETSTGKCTPSCTPNCNGKQCGDDGCGGDCGPCGTTSTCEYGQCVANPPTGSFGAACNLSSPACATGFACVGLQAGSANGGFCSKVCPTIGDECPAYPTGTLSGCMLTDDTATNYCAFVCAFSGQSFSCPGGMTCDPQEDPPGSGQRICLP